MFWFIIIGVIAFIILAYGFLISPGRPKNFPRALTSYKYAHRGLHSLESPNYPENSISAIHLAVENGFGIEIDLQATEDEQIVVFHDNDLERMTGFSGHVERTPWQIIKTLRLNHDESHPIPLFKQVLDKVDGKVPLLIEIKPQVKYKVAVPLIMAELKDYKGEFMIQSFHPLILRKVKKINPNIKRGILSMGFSYKPQNNILDILKNLVTANLLFNFLARPHFVSYNVRSKTNKSMLILKKLWRIPFFAWTVNNEKVLSKAEGFYDTIIFEKIHIK